MREIVDRDEKTKREVWDRDKAINHFRKKGELYKAELIESIPKERMYLFIFMVIGTIYVEDLIYLRLEKSENILN